MARKRKSGYDKNKQCYQSQMQKIFMKMPKYKIKSDSSEAVNFIERLDLCMMSEVVKQASEILQILIT